MSRLALSLPLLMLLACKSSSGSNSDESSSSSGDPGSSSSTDAPTTAPSDESSSSSSTSEVADSTETGPVSLTVSGEVSDFFEMGPIGFAQISLLGEKGSETVSNQDGTYEIDGLEPNSFHRILLAGNANYWGAIVPVQLEDESIDKYDLSQVSNAVIDLQEEALQNTDPEVVVDKEESAVLLIALNQNTATGAEVLIDPPPATNTYYAPDANGSPILNSNMIEWGLFPVAIFFNLPPGDEGTYTITVTHPERECVVQDPEPPTLAKHVNLVYVDCL